VGGGAGAEAAGKRGVGLVGLVEDRERRTKKRVRVRVRVMMMREMQRRSSLRRGV
jgi:ACT domain-containing protein